MYRIAKEKNLEVETNKTLMLMTPLAIWARKLSSEELFLSVSLLTSLIIPHELVVMSCYLYCYAIKLIINGEISQNVYEKLQEEADRMARKTGLSTVKYWLENDIDVNNLDEMPKAHYRPISYVKTAIIWAFYYLKCQSSYGDALRDTLKRGGDTSMNAAITCGLIGALNIDNSKLHQLLNEIDTFKQNEDSAGINYASN